MSNRTDTPKVRTSKTAYYIYFASILLLVISGFAQMPIFKRYYVADIPGFGWLAEFYVTHFLHYLSASAFIGLTIYIVLDHFLSNRRVFKLTVSGYVRVVILAGLAGSGLMLVLRNLSGAYFRPDFIVMMDLGHLCLVMGLLMVSLYCVIFREPWVRIKSPQ